MSETMEQLKARLNPAGAYTCDGCGRTNETGEWFAYRSFGHHFCTPCAHAFDAKAKRELLERIREDESDTPTDTQGTNEIMFPYCGYEFSDSWEMPESGTTHCPECDKEFDYERDVSVSYGTTRISEGDAS